MAENKPKDIWIELRKPFPKESVGKLPKGNTMIDYVGHAATTDRLNTVDPTWTWEPMAYTQDGIPFMTTGVSQYGKPSVGLWIKLTIGGVTRPGFGDGPDEKQAIGDAIRNAAMRFGVALDLWSKDELESNVENPENKNFKPSQQPMYPKRDEAPVDPAPAPNPDTPNPKARQTPNKAKFDELTHAFNSIYMTENVKKIDFIRGILGHPMPNNDEEVDRIIKAIEEKK